MAGTWRSLSWKSYLIVLLFDHFFFLLYAQTLCQGVISGRSRLTSRAEDERADTPPSGAVLLSIMPFAGFVPQSQGCSAKQRQAKSQGLTWTVGLRGEKRG